MSIIASSDANRRPSGVHLSELSALLGLCVRMMKKDDVKKLWEREELSIKDKLGAYLDGYMMSFDMYPVCERHLFIRNDAYALLRDFFAVGEDMNKAARRLLTASDEEFSETGVELNEIRKRRVEAAKRALAAIEQAKSTRDSE